MKKYLVIIVTCLFVLPELRAQSWTNLGVGLGEQVNALAVYNGNLYAGGAFTMDGGSTSLLHISKWTGTNWIAVGSGLNGDVYALAVYNNALYAAGNFTISGSTAVSHIAKWDGFTWSALGGGLNNFANCLMVYNNELYAGGVFTTANGSTTVNRVAKWNGTTWSALGAGIPGGIVNAMAVYNNEIYIGGTFSGYVNKFNGSTWSTVGNISNGTSVNCLAAWGPNGVSSGSTYYLYAGGDFSNPSQGIVRWNGSSWSSAVQSFSSVGKPKVFLPTFSYLYAGGGFNIPVNIPSPHNVISVGKFNNSYWDSVGTGMNADVLALTVFNGVLHSGGAFITADGVSAKYVARRNVTVGIDETDSRIITKEFFPNPLVEYSILKIQSTSTLTLPELKILDVTGKELNPVSELVKLDKISREAEFRIERSGLPSGIYFYKLTDQDLTITTGKFIIE
ncbi:MAG: T9SS type A sorting domain-containing protein [Bacteroidetes bacterium]|nr:T9SS type A sorting domain-containing protein [Bacteroidota bacterium]